MKATLFNFHLVQKLSHENGECHLFSEHGESMGKEGMKKEEGRDCKFKSPN